MQASGGGGGGLLKRDMPDVGIVCGDHGDMCIDDGIVHYGGGPMLKCTEVAPQWLMIMTDMCTCTVIREKLDI